MAAHHSIVVSNDFFFQLFSCGVVLLVYWTYESWSWTSESWQQDDD